jgi:hypothetical protein
MKLDVTMATDRTVSPNTSPQRWNQTISKIRLAMPDRKNATAVPFSITL